MISKLNLKCNYFLIFIDLFGEGYITSENGYLYGTYRDFIE